MRPAPARPCPILVVDDDPDVREVLAEVLRDEGFTVSTAADGQEALEILRSHPRPCVLLLDWLMPRLDGEGLLERLTSEGAFEGLTIFVTTLFDGRISDARVTRVLRKPYDFSELLGLLDRHCRPPR